MNIPEKQTIELNEQHIDYLSELLIRYRTEITAEQRAFRSRFNDVLHDNLDTQGIAEQRSIACKEMVILLLHRLLNDGAVSKELLDDGEVADEAFAIVRDFNDAGSRDTETSFEPVERTIILNESRRELLESKLAQYIARCKRLRVDYKTSYPAGHDPQKLTAEQRANKIKAENAIYIVEKRILALQTLLKEGTVTMRITNRLEMYDVYKILENYNTSGGESVTREVPKKWWQFWRRNP